MIQRIQSLYLLIAAVLMAVLCFVPFASFLWEGGVFRQTVWGIVSTGEFHQMAVRTIPMGILTAISALLPLIIIFLYKNRKLQLRLCIVEVVLLIGVMIYMAMYLLRSGSDLTDKMAFSTVDLFPILSLILVLMALKRIVKDEILVRSLDRIR